ncbi:MAG: arginine repressor [Vicinamibacterales bacterium]|jgi:transcriptional regulator of arginine metabolism|nr:arginine repressor [Acidobacteriota bacterium]MDP7472354.1 arginine repressor [Vicinamibacterales bacterium]MDP7670719.1 arginine repressor [Vicinamibacterales bacterium]HJO38998.1 arginine repressor [Vicinamibacterales bacterium]|tara:strand:- start:1260 stop:1712 length:453 start_codon:yes stop_codon:yes gene_type:complete
MKQFRQAAIVDLVSHEAIHSQAVLRKLLKRQGFDATQATLSRDIKELGLVKRAADGAYQRADIAPARATDPRAEVQRAVADYLKRIDRVEQLIVLKTDPGEAQLLALAIDQAAYHEVVGTIGGDDTILVIGRHRRAAADIAKRFETWAKA